MGFSCKLLFFYLFYNPNDNIHYFTNSKHNNRNFPPFHEISTSFFASQEGKGGGELLPFVSPYDFS